MIRRHPKMAMLPSPKCIALVLATALALGIAGAGIAGAQPVELVTDEMPAESLATKRADTGWKTPWTSSRATPPRAHRSQPTRAIAFGDWTPAIFRPSSRDVRGVQPSRPLILAMSATLRTTSPLLDGSASNRTALPDNAPIKSPNSEMVVSRPVPTLKMPDGPPRASTLA